MYYCCGSPCYAHFYVWSLAVHAAFRILFLCLLALPYCFSANFCFALLIFQIWLQDSFMLRAVEILVKLNSMFAGDVWSRIWIEFLNNSNGFLKNVATPLVLFDYVPIAQNIYGSLKMCWSSFRVCLFSCFWNCLFAEWTTVNANISIPIAIGNKLKMVCKHVEQPFKKASICRKIALPLNIFTITRELFNNMSIICEIQLSRLS